MKRDLKTVLESPLHTLSLHPIRFDLKSSGKIVGSKKIMLFFITFS